MYKNIAFFQQMHKTNHKSRNPLDEGLSINACKLTDAREQINYHNSLGGCVGS